MSALIRLETSAETPEAISPATAAFTAPETSVEAAPETAERYGRAVGYLEGSLNRSPFNGITWLSRGVSDE